jgi:hypothetical protein
MVVRNQGGACSPLQSAGLGVGYLLISAMKSAVEGGWVARGGRRAGAGRPRKPVEQHLAEGTYRPGRHRRLIAPPLVPPPGRKRSPEGRWEELIGWRHWRFSRRQLELVRQGPAELSFPFAREGDEAEALAAAWAGWNKRFGLRWRLQNECPYWLDASRLAVADRFAEDDYEWLVALVEEHVRGWDSSLPDPPGWDELGRTGPVEVDAAGLVLPVGCGNCGAKLNLLPASVAAAVPEASLPLLRAALAELHDREQYGYALADSSDHFPCPRCGEVEYVDR